MLWKEKRKEKKKRNTSLLLLSFSSSSFLLFLLFLSSLCLFCLRASLHHFVLSKKHIDVINRNQNQDQRIFSSRVSGRKRADSPLFHFYPRLTPKPRRSAEKLEAAFSFFTYLGHGHGSRNENGYSERDAGRSRINKYRYRCRGGNKIESSGKGNRWLGTEKRGRIQLDKYETNQNYRNTRLRLFSSLVESESESKILNDHDNNKDSSNSNTFNSGEVNSNSNDKTKSRKSIKKDKGRPHTEESRAKIAAANKGKTPWNAGKRHSEETRRKIAEKTRLAMLERKRKKVEALGLTMEQYEHQRKLETIAKKFKHISFSDIEHCTLAMNDTALTFPNGTTFTIKEVSANRHTSETRRKISQNMKRLWKDPEYRAKGLERLNSTRSMQTDETREKISNKMKERWSNGELSRRNTTLSIETRQKISETLKKKYATPEFQEKLKARTRSEEHNQKISDAIKAKWQTDEYRNKTLGGINSQREIAMKERRANPSAKSSLSRRGISQGGRSGGGGSGGGSGYGGDGLTTRERDAMKSKKAKLLAGLDAALGVDVEDEEDGFLDSAIGDHQSQREILKSKLAEEKRKKLQEKTKKETEKKKERVSKISSQAKQLWNHIYDEDDSLHQKPNHHHHAGIDTAGGEPSLNIIHAGDQSTSGNLDFIENKWNDEDEEEDEWESAYNDDEDEEDDEDEDEDDDMDIEFDSDHEGDYINDNNAKNNNNSEKFKGGEGEEGETVVIGLSSEIPSASTSGSTLSKDIQNEIREKLLLGSEDLLGESESEREENPTPSPSKTKNTSTAESATSYQSNSPNTATFKIVNGKLIEDD